MRRAPAAILTLLLAMATPVPAIADGIAIGQYRDWGAFRRAKPAACLAVADPVGRRRTPGPFLAVTTWPAWRLSRQVQVRLRRPAAAAVLAIGDRRFPLRVAGQDGVAAGAADNRRIAALLRGRDSARVTARTRDGRRFTDVYALAGAASAIDAAGVACLGAR